jgi:uncharacterized SAM-binding protein YcdF (DUF218 family)
VKNPLPSSILGAISVAFDYLSETDAPSDRQADAVIGFGTFDVMLASFCGELYAQQRARRIVFTGGVGSGTADLGMPEADAWRKQLARTHPGIPPGNITTENRSTNTAENIAFTAELLMRNNQVFNFERGLKHALIVASPSRLRRVKLTLQRLQPNLRTTRHLPSYANFEHEAALYEAKGIDYLAHLIGELDRLVAYPARGWIAAEVLPKRIAAAHAILCEHCNAK